MSSSWASFVDVLVSRRLSLLVACKVCSVVVCSVVSCWLKVSDIHEVSFHGVPFQAVLCCSELGRVVCEIVVVPSSHLEAGRPRFPYPFCSVDIAGLHFSMRLVQRSSWCLVIILAGFQHALLCRRSMASFFSHSSSRPSCGLRTPCSHSRALVRLLLLRRLVAHCSKRSCCDRRGCFLLAR